MSARPFCWKCRHSLRTCFCSEVKPFEAGIRFVLAVHPKEARNRVGTARIVERSIINSLFLEGTGKDLDQNGTLAALCSDPQFQVGVLFPGKAATPLEQWQPREGRALALIVIDGTWPQASKMIKESKLLQSVPRVSLQPKSPSQYRIRRQPQEGCLSTLEAVVESIRVLGQAGIASVPPRGEHEHLLSIFQHMVDQQIGFQNRHILV